MKVLRDKEIVRIGKGYYEVIVCNKKHYHRINLRKLKEFEKLMKLPLDELKSEEKEDEN